MTLATNLDGKYAVVSKSSYDGPHEQQSDGFTVIQGGKTMRIDGDGCQWNSTFEWVGDDKVKMTSHVDATYAEPGFRLVDSDGNPTSQPQSYEAILDVKDKDGLPVMSGTFHFGARSIYLSLRRVAGDR